MKKIKWFYLLNGIILIFIGITFISVKFYDIQKIIEYNGMDYIISGLNYASFMEVFDEIFKVSYANILLFLLFLSSGIIEIIKGVKKNGN